MPTAYLAELDRRRAAERAGSADGVNLLTYHRAKGLEWDAVFLPALEEGLLPIRQAFDDDELLAEERRLLYVGITRARNHLWISWAAERETRGRTTRREPSRFLADLRPRGEHRVDPAPGPIRPGPGRAPDGQQGGGRQSLRRRRRRPAVRGAPWLADGPGPGRCRPAVCRRPRPDPGGHRGHQAAECRGAPAGEGHRAGQGRGLRRRDPGAGPPVALRRRQAGSGKVVSLTMRPASVERPPHAHLRAAVERARSHHRAVLAIERPVAVHLTVQELAGGLDGAGRVGVGHLDRRRVSVTSSLREVLHDGDRPVPIRSSRRSGRRSSRT